ncbi:MAG: hypothetical protein A2Y38_10110 [Spirochaetes bacterium GWB1_59_5]|nr:MAG: hypothetical protein A2Y38_10110 [Spirochaetes bacterium GWB1_59_5]
MKKTYEVEHEWAGSMKVEIDTDVMTEAELDEINNFWGNADYRLAMQEDNVLHAVLVMLLFEATCVQLEGNLNLHGVVEAFNYDANCGRRGIEGWPKMDGTQGIQIVHFEGMVFEESDVTVKDITNYQEVTA